MAIKLTLYKMGLLLPRVCIPSQCPRFLRSDLSEKLAGPLSDRNSTFKKITKIEKPFYLLGRTQAKRNECNYIIVQFNVSHSKLILFETNHCAQYLLKVNNG